MAQKKVFKISDEQIKTMYLEGNSLNDIAKIAQDTKGLMALRQRLIDLGVDTTKDMKRYKEKISKYSRKYKVKEDVFDCIDSEEKAYWLGWYMTDGYNYQTRNYVALRLQEKDREILEKLRTFLETDAPIHTFTRNSGRYVELSVCSSHISNSLASLGVVQHKVYNKSIPDIEYKYIRSFLRGYFDGDGCVSITHRKDRGENSKTYQVTFTGNKEPMLFIEQVLRKELGINYRQLHPHKKSYTLYYSGRNICTKVLNWLYKDATVYLQRKFNKYKEYCISVE